MDITEYIALIRNHLLFAFGETGKWFHKDPALCKYKPANGGWSIDEILEHISITNHYLLVLIQKGCKKAMNKLPSADLMTELTNYDFDIARLKEISMHQSFIWNRPAHMEPEGRMSMQEIDARLKAQVQECMDILYSMPSGEGILHKTTMSVNNLGKIDVYQYIYFLAQHILRHISQMEKVEKEYYSS